MHVLAAAAVSLRAAAICNEMSCSKHDTLGQPRVDGSKQQLTCSSASVLLAKRHLPGSCTGFQLF